MKKERILIEVEIETDGEHCGDDCPGSYDDDHEIESCHYFNDWTESDYGNFPKIFRLKKCLEAKKIVSK